MQRILIVGSGGAGKSTLAMRMGASLSLPVVHLDREYWTAGWQPMERAAWKARVAELLQQRRWIIDGNYTGTLPLRIAAADTVVFLDFPRWTCLSRVLRRRWDYRGKSRPDVAAGCEERITFEFLWWIWRFPDQTRPEIMRIIDANRAGKRVIVLRSADEAGAFEREMAEVGPAPLF